MTNIHYHKQMICTSQQIPAHALQKQHHYLVTKKRVVWEFQVYDLFFFLLMVHIKTAYRCFTVYYIFKKVRELTNSSKKKE